MVVIRQTVHQFQPHRIIDLATRNSSAAVSANLHLLARHADSKVLGIRALHESWRAPRGPANARRRVYNRNSCNVPNQSMLVCNYDVTQSGLIVPLQLLLFSQLFSVLPFHVCFPDTSAESSPTSGQKLAARVRWQTFRWSSTCRKCATPPRTHTTPTTT